MKWSLMSITIFNFQNEKYQKKGSFPYNKMLNLKFPEINTSLENVKEIIVE